MVLAMSRPWKYPVTHVYYFRKAVPDDLRLVLDKQEVGGLCGRKTRLRHVAASSQWPLK